jgi:hypothetical protein
MCVSKSCMIATSNHSFLQEAAAVKLILQKIVLPRAEIIKPAVFWRSCPFILICYYYYCCFVL